MPDIDAITVARSTGVNLTTSGVSASATIPLDTVGNKPRYIRISASFAAYVRLDKTTATAVNTDMMVQPGDAVIVQVGQYDKVAALQVAAAGVVQVSALDDVS
jgi:hypothetical protein